MVAVLAETATLTPELIRVKIDALELLEDLMSAISDVSGIEPEDAAPLLLRINDKPSSFEERPVAAVSALPADLLLLGLRAMRDAAQRRVQELV